MKSFVGTGFWPVLSYRRDYVGNRGLWRIDQTPAGGDSSSLGTVVGGELGEDRTDVELDGPLADEQPLSYIPVR